MFTRGGVANQLLASITAITGVINQSYDSEMRLSKYAQFLKLEPFVKNTGTKLINEVKNIEFKKVSFTYPNTKRLILKNISFYLNQNKSIALVGLNGAGKWTIVKLLLRLYDPDTERRLFEKMYNLGKDKCVVYMTHRLSSATTAGKIFVISNGICIEKGTHQELMELKGSYFDLFSKQAEHYKEQRDKQPC